MAAGPSLSRGLAVRLPLAWGSTRRLAAGLLVLGAMIRALRFADRFDEWMPTDGSRLAIPAIEILRGPLPVDHLGVEYMGASPSYPLAAWFALAGTSTLAFDLFAYGVGLAILWTSYLVARRLLDRSAALLTLAVLAVPPPLLAQFSMHVQLNYPIHAPDWQPVPPRNTHPFLPAPRVFGYAPGSGPARRSWLVDEPTVRGLPRALRAAPPEDRPHMARSGLALPCGCAVRRAPGMGLRVLELPFRALRRDQGSVAASETALSAPPRSPRCTRRPGFSCYRFAMTFPRIRKLLSRTQSLYRVCRHQVKSIFTL